MLLTSEWLESRDAAKHPIACRTAMPLTAKNHVAQKVNSARLSNISLAGGVKEALKEATQNWG